MSILVIRLADQLVVGAGIVVLLVIGFLGSRRSKTDEGYFLAGRSLPGWVVGFSLMATIVSSMTFLATPAFSYGDNNWNNIFSSYMYIPAVAVAVFLFIPFYRRMGVTTAYEYLERRFGLWARVYASIVFVSFHFFRTGLVLYAVSLAIRSILGLAEETLPLVIICAGGLVALYTIVGGLHAVIWTDVFQGVALILGGLVCVPLIVWHLPGGFEELFRVATTDNKFDLGNTSFTFTERTVWAYMIAELVTFLHLLGTDQTNVQRYCAAKSDKAARQAAIIGCCLAIPTWTYFLFLGTALYVFVKVVPATGLEGLQADEVFPQFILTHVPPGVAGIVLTGLLASAMSTLDSSINATASTVTTDIYKRLWVKERSPRHYATVGRLVSLVFGAVMIGMACGIHALRASEALDNVQRMLLAILGGGLLSLFLAGFLTRRVDSRAALIATVTTVLSIAAWLLLKTPFAAETFPLLHSFVPDNFWTSAFANVLLFIVAYTTSFIVGSREKSNLAGLTIWGGKSSRPD